jgi:pimeloyl-ACP methyl ester carboxylesterase
MTRADARGMRTAVLRLLAAATVVLGLVSGCTGVPSSQPTRPSQSAQGLAGLKDMRPCPGIAGFRCGSLSVRLDPFGSVPGKLSLRVAVSGVASAPRGVLLFLTGGPGEPGVPFVPRLQDRLGPALRGYRLVMFDQRGTGAGAVDCPALQRQMGASDLTVPSPAAVRSCAAAIGPDRRFYATADTVAELSRLRSDALLGRGVGHPAEVLVQHLAEHRLGGSGVQEQRHGRA